MKKNRLNAFEGIAMLLLMSLTVIAFIGLTVIAFIGLITIVLMENK